MNAPPISVVLNWFPASEIRSWTPIGSGLSGGSVWKIELHAGTNWALRQWPQATDSHRVQQIHRLLEHQSNRGCPVVPGYRLALNQNSRWLIHAGSIWDCAEWIPGDPSDSHLSAERYAEEMAMGAARFSWCLPRIALRGKRVAAISERSNRLRELDAIVSEAKQRLGELARRHPLSSEDPVLIDAVERFLAVWPQEAPRMQTALLRHHESLWPVTWVVRDCHRGNAIFREGRLIAWIDFDACRQDTPAVDLGRIVSSLACDLASIHHPRVGGFADGDGIEQRAVEAYRRIQPMSEQEVALMLDFCWINPLITLGNWLSWCLLESREFALRPFELAARVRGWVDAVVQR